MNQLEMLLRSDEFITKRRYYGIYRGVIENIEDPEYRLRVKVRVHGVNELDPNKVSTNALPWAEYAAPSGGGVDHGTVDAPFNIGDTVFVQFVGGNKRMPVYFATWYSMAESSNYQDPQTPTEVWQDENGNRKAYSAYLQRFVKKTPHGHTFEISDEPDDLEIVLRTADGKRVWLRESSSGSGKGQASGLLIEDEAGNQLHLNTENSVLTVNAAADLNIVVGGDATISVQGDTSIDSQGDVDVTTQGTIEWKGFGGASPTGGVVVGGVNGTICPFTGRPHFDESTNVKATKN